MATTRIPTSLEIAQRATLRPIAELADGLGLAPDGLEQFGRYKAKVDLSVLDRLHTRHDAPLICVTFVVRDLVPYTGAGWVVALAGDMMTMPGLGRDPAALHIDVGADGQTVGLF